jgi:hypothetical protein
MKLLHRLISAGFAIAAIASASVPAVAWSVSGGNDQSLSAGASP